MRNGTPRQARGDLVELVDREPKIRKRRECLLGRRLLRRDDIEPPSGSPA